jgi:hypothetical protein
MNRNIASALILAAAAVAGNAFADDITIDTTPFVSTMSRADVHAELVQFKKAGTSPWSIQYNPLASFKSTVTSEQVVAAYLASRGEVAAFGSEDSGSSYLALTRPDTGGVTLAGRPRNHAQ